MRTFIVIWTYYGINGAEQGSLRIEAESPEAAEEEFYRYNRPAWKDEWNIGYVAEGIEEVSE
ncbi:MAG: hypothetical protein IJV14_03100 [Lachnospiraceae bacterium]|nr:hypothetical protein [Lachnospiraceae bacterium]